MSRSLGILRLNIASQNRPCRAVRLSPGLRAAPCLSPSSATTASFPVALCQAVAAIATSFTFATFAAASSSSTATTPVSFAAASSEAAS